MTTVRPGIGGPSAAAGRTHVACLVAVLTPGLAGGPPGSARTAGGWRIERAPPSVTVQAPSAASVDTLEVRRRARAAQRAFERTRRQHFPAADRRRDGERCHEIVGRYCVWHDPKDPWYPPPEPAAVTSARDGLLAELDELAGRAPGDRWIQGQRVRYLIEAGRLEEAVELASSCRAAEPAWCRALLGFALHAAGDDVGSEAAFVAALGEMPEEERCRWMALDDLLGREGRRYRSLECDERGEWEALFWRLADPLYLIPGNARRAEHFSRHVMDGLQEDAASGYDARWRRDLSELLLRYGWPAGWTRHRSRGPGLRREEVITAHDAPGARRFEPRADWVGRPDRVGRADWRLDPERPRTLYAPAYVAFLDSLEHQLARFARGDSVVVVAAYDLSRDTMPACNSLERGLFVADSLGERLAQAVGETPGEAGVLRVALLRGAPAPARTDRPLASDAATGPHWVSFEVLCARDRWAARSRYGVSLATPNLVGLSLSDFLVLANPGDGAPPAKLAEAMPLALGRLHARVGERLGLYWELYDTAGGGREVDVTVTLTRTDKGFLRKVVEWAGLAREGEEAVGLQWRERSDGAALSSRTIALDLSALPEGTYRLSLRVEVPEGRLETSRVLHVEKVG